MSPVHRTDAATLLGYAIGMALSFLAVGGFFVHFWLLMSAPRLVWPLLGLLALLGAAVGVWVGRSDAAPLPEQGDVPLG